MPDLDSLSIDQRYAVKLAAATLHAEHDESGDAGGDGQHDDHGNEDGGHNAPFRTVGHMAVRPGEGHCRSRSGGTRTRIFIGSTRLGAEFGGVSALG